MICNCHECEEELYYLFNIKDEEFAIANAYTYIKDVYGHPSVTINTVMIMFNKNIVSDLSYFSIPKNEINNSQYFDKNHIDALKPMLPFFACTPHTWLLVERTKDGNFFYNWKETKKPVWWLELMER